MELKEQIYARVYLQLDMPFATARPWDDPRWNARYDLGRLWRSGQVRGHGPRMIWTSSRIRQSPWLHCERR
jgi:hypothetical protein